ncbi:MAG: Crp/Fnr family transcriptional regulator [Acidiferrobacterales bacterium]
MTDMLKNIPLFANLSEADLAKLESHAVTKTFPKNSIIINEGDTTDSLYITVSGKVKAFLRNERDKEVILSIQGPGEYFGEIALLDEAPRSASVMTLENSSFLIITQASFRACLGEHPDIAISLIRGLTHRVRALTDSVKSLALEDVYGRIAKTLSHLAQEEDGKLIIRGKLTQQDIAAMVGASREMVSRIFKDLTAGGYIKIEDKKITLEKKLPARW